MHQNPVLNFQSTAKIHCSYFCFRGQCGQSSIGSSVMKTLIVSLILLLSCSGSFMAMSTSKKRWRDIHQMINRHRKHTVKIIKSENGEVIACVPLDKQPAFSHPSLKNHKIQMKPSAGTFSSKSVSSDGALKQVWHKYGNCPKGTIPVRRADAKVIAKSNRPVESYGKKAEEVRIPKDIGNKYILPQHSTNTSRGFMITAGYAYLGATADMDVANPHVQYGDEYSLAEVAVINGDDKNYEIAEAGWAVNPGLYGNRGTHFFVRWSVGSVTARTGCFDLTCPGFIQTSEKIALGGAMDIPVPGGLGGAITIWLVKDLENGNWWVKTGMEQQVVGYFPANLFTGLNHMASIVQWGGEVHSPKIGPAKPHTETEMGNGWKSRTEMRNINVMQNNRKWQHPYPTGVVVDEINCYDAEYHSLLDEPIFLYGGSGMYCNPSS